MKNENGSSKSPRKPITEIEKQRRELNKLKGENLEECLNKHREAYKLIKSNQIQMTTLKKTSQKQNFKKRSRSFDSSKNEDSKEEKKHECMVKKNSYFLTSDPKIKDPKRPRRHLTCEASFEMKENKANSNEKFPPRRLPFNRKLSKNGESFPQNHSNVNLSLSQDEDTHIEDSFMMDHNEEFPIEFKYTEVTIVFDSRLDKKDDIKRLINRLSQFMAKTCDKENEFIQKSITLLDVNHLLEIKAPSAPQCNQKTTNDIEKQHLKNSYNLDICIIRTYESNSDGMSPILSKFNHQENLLFSNQKIRILEANTFIFNDSSKTLVVSLLSNLTDADQDEKVIRLQELLFRMNLKYVNWITVASYSEKNSALYHYCFRKHGGNFMEVACIPELRVIYAFTYNRNFFEKVKSFLENCFSETTESLTTEKVLYKGMKFLVLSSGEFNFNHMDLSNFDVRFRTIASKTLD